MKGRLNGYLLTDYNSYRYPSLLYLKAVPVCFYDGTAFLYNSVVYSGGCLGYAILSDYRIYLLFLYGIFVLFFYQRYRSIRLASNLNSVNSSIVKPQRDEPPYEKNGNGIPMTGQRPITIPTFIVKWNISIDATQYP